MLLSEVGYARPATLEQALGVLADYPGARALAGGQTLVNVMKARAAAPDVLVDLARIPGLKEIELGSDGTLELGAMVTYTELVASAEARARPILGEVCAQIADVQVRNRGTIGGNVCSSDPTNHLPPLFVALGADFTVVGPGGDRIVPAQDFFLGVYMTAAGPGELLTKITVPPGRSDGFASVPIGVDGTCIVHAAATVNGGVRLALPPSQVTVLDVFSAVEQERPLFQAAALSRLTGEKVTKVQGIIFKLLGTAEESMKSSLQAVTIESLLQAIN